MATFTMTASFLSAAGPAIRSPAPTQRRLVVVTASKSAQVASSSCDKNQESNNGRRDLIFAAAAAAAAMCSVAGIALADEPKRGTAEAKKKYAPVCVTMPTARICRN